ncbi:hypothetical protein B0H16DRAFT_1742691 [Mycena metata]|uniref:Uncharacterized protein n=1 Tax=Mycena metata TaxID=1033252 RepID=A0AAD7MFG5_9AGAR|nr:hypothetical protein B0H16DRAFT_1742691 [Mycena metata]
MLQKQGGLSGISPTPPTSLSPTTTTSDSFFSTPFSLSPSFPMSTPRLKPTPKRKPEASTGTSTATAPTSTSAAPASTPTSGAHAVWGPFNHHSVADLSQFLLEPPTIAKTDESTLRKALHQAIPALLYWKENFGGLNLPKTFLRFIQPLGWIYRKLKVVPVGWLEFLPPLNDTLEYLPANFEIPFVPPPVLSEPPALSKGVKMWNVEKGEFVKPAPPPDPNSKAGLTAAKLKAEGEDAKKKLRASAPGSSKPTPAASKSVPRRPGPGDYAPGADETPERSPSPTPVQGKGKGKAKAEAPPAKRTTRSVDGTAPLKRPHSPDAPPAKPKGVKAEGTPAPSASKKPRGAPAPPNEFVKVTHMPPRARGDPASKAKYDWEVDEGEIVSALADAVKKLNVDKPPLSAEVDSSAANVDVNLKPSTKRGILWMIRQRRGKPFARFFSQISPFSTTRQSRARKGHTEHEPKFLPIRKVEDQLVFECDFSEAGIPPSACIICTILLIDCTRIGFGSSCVQCQLLDARLCDHAKTIEELIIFHAEIARNYALASDVTEVIIYELVASCKRAQTAAALYREASEDLRTRFRWFAAHMFKCIDYMGTDKFFERFSHTDASPTVRHYTQLLIDQFNWAELPKEDRSDRIPSGYTKADADKFFELNFAALDLDDFEENDPDDRTIPFHVEYDSAGIPFCYRDTHTFSPKNGRVAYPPTPATLQDIANAKSDEGSEEEEEEVAAESQEEEEAEVEDVTMGAPDDETEEEAQEEEPEAGPSTVAVKSKKPAAKKAAPKKRTSSRGRR